MKPFESVTVSDESIFDYPATHRVLRNLSRYGLWDGPEPTVVDTATYARRLSFESTNARAPLNHPVGLGKRHLHLTTQPGAFLKQCPGSDGMLCCHYHVVNMVSNCPYDCSYCYLQTYLNQPMLTLYVNEEDIFSQVRAICSRPPVSQLRIGTGEIADSLALDPITGFSERLATVMADYKNVRLELKTKSKNVEHLTSLHQKDHVVLAWSMNPPIIVDAEEHGTARFEERVAAASLAAKSGFQVAFHFDPMILIPDWESHYEEAARILLAAVPHDKISWISMGGLRYLPQLKPMALKRRPETSIYFEESVQGSDGKIRYLRFNRAAMFAHLNQIIKKLAPSVYTYLCMETKPVWEKALGRLPDREF